MINAFLTVGQQVLTLFILLAIGFAMGKLYWLDDWGAAGISNILLYIVTPAILLTSFQREFVAADFRNFGLILSASTILHLLLLGSSCLAIHDADVQRQRILRFAVIFSNCGYMGYPLMQALVGKVGVYYGSAYVVVFNVLAWTLGVYMISGDKKKLRLRPLLCNPGVLGTVAALTLYLLQIKIPDILMTPLEHISNLNTPLPMIVIGYQLSQANVKKAFQGLNTLLTTLLRLVISPLLALGICLLLGLRGDVAIVLMVAASTPPAALLGMFAVKYKADASTASSMVSGVTALSILTMPLFVGLAQYLLG